MAGEVRLVVEPGFEGCLGDGSAAIDELKREVAAHADVVVVGRAAKLSPESPKKRGTRHAFGPDELGERENTIGGAIESRKHPGDQGMAHPTAEFGDFGREQRICGGLEELRPLRCRSLPVRSVQQLEKAVTRPLVSCGDHQPFVDRGAPHEGVLFRGKLDLGVLNFGARDPGDPVWDPRRDGDERRGRHPPLEAARDGNVQDTFDDDADLERWVMVHG